jgi:hypothetical protein
MNTLNLRFYNQYKPLFPTRHHDIHSRIASGVDPAAFPFVSQIQESRIEDDPVMFGFKIAVLAFTSSLSSNRNVFKVRSSVPSRTIADQTRLYTLQQCEIRSEAFLITARDLVQMAFECVPRMTWEY